MAICFWGRDWWTRLKGSNFAFTQARNLVCRMFLEKRAAYEDQGANELLRSGRRGCRIRKGACLGTLAPRVGIVLGSGLGAAAGGGRRSGESSPTAKFLIFRNRRLKAILAAWLPGQLAGGAPAIVMQGRVHYYEGYSPLEVTFPMRVLQLCWGCAVVVLTNAAGAISDDILREAN